MKSFSYLSAVSGCGCYVLTLHFLSFQSSVLYVSGYITSQGAVPPVRQMKWLKQLTNDICQLKIGELSSVQVSQSRELMYEWSHNPTLYDLCDEKDECAIAVESLLKRVVDEQKAVKIGVELTVHDYNCVLEGWARSAGGGGSGIQTGNNNMVAAERCEQILDAMIQYGPQPDLTSYKACFMAWRQTVDKITNQQKGSTMNTYNNQNSKKFSNNSNNNNSNSNNPTTTTRSRKEQPSMKPPATTASTSSTTSRTNVLDDNTTHGAYRAQRLLENMIRSYTDEPSTTTTTTNDNKDVVQQQQVVVVQRTGVLPDADCFDIVLQTWSKSGAIDAPTQCEYTLSLMDKLQRITGRNELRPRRSSCNAVLTAWARSGATNAPDRAAAILKYMELRARVDEDITLVPDRASYNIVMNALAHHHDPFYAAKKADAFVRHVVTMYQQSIMTNNNLDESSVTTDSSNENTNKDKNSQQQSNNNNVSTKLVPDTILFNTAMGLWGKVKVNPNNNIVITNKSSNTDSVTTTTTDVVVEPSATSSSSSPPTTAKPSRPILCYIKARSILDCQLNLFHNYNCRSCQPDVVSFTSVINCCAQNESIVHKKDAFRVAVSTYRELQALSRSLQQEKNGSKTVSAGTSVPSLLEANHFTYSAMVKVCSKCTTCKYDGNINSKMNLFIRELFQDCTKHGYVNEMFLQRLRDATHSTIYSELMQGYNKHTIPKEWSRNIHNNQHHHYNKNTNHNNFIKKKHVGNFDHYNNNNKRKSAEV